MNLTFKGFLRGYCQELTGLETISLKKFFTAVLDDSPAAAEPLMCFAAIQGKTDYLVRLAKDTPFEASYQVVAHNLKTMDSLEAYLASDNTPERYRKVWLAYRSKKYAIIADRRVIALMREKTLEALETTPRSVYSLCKQLNLNRGNVCAYLNGGDATKVSKATARRLLEAASTNFEK